jgi:competence ComEA-like helix-hairpin-helix protein
MPYFNGTELRSLLLATGLLLLGAAARVGLAPEPDEFSWTQAAGPAASLSATRRQVSEGVAEEEAAAIPLGRDETIDPNRAPVALLRRLPGVGPVRAQAIVKERISGGPFRGPADLARVPGIGPRTVEALEPHLTFGSRPGAGAGTPRQRSFSASATLVDVNRAQIKELEQITGIGPALASRIVATRQRFGPFERAEDLLRVPGIGPVVLQRISRQLRF